LVRFFKIISVIFLLALASCQGNETNTAPDNIIPEEKMVEILTNVHLIEGARTGLVITGDSVHGINEYYKALYVKYNITQAEFDSSFVYYSKDPKVFDKMFEKVIENLSVIESELKSD